MDNFYMLSDSDILEQIGTKLKDLRLKQNISQQMLSDNSGVSLPTVVRIENGNIKSFDSFIRILRVLGKLDIFESLVNEDAITPNEYYKMVTSANTAKRKRATRNNLIKTQEESKCFRHNR